MRGNLSFNLPSCTQVHLFVSFTGTIRGMWSRWRPVRSHRRRRPNLATATVRPGQLKIENAHLGLWSQTAAYLSSANHCLFPPFRQEMRISSMYTFYFPDFVAKLLRLSSCNWLGGHASVLAMDWYGNETLHRTPFFNMTIKGESVAAVQNVDNFSFAYVVV